MEESEYTMLAEFAHLQMELGGRHRWARDFCRRIGQGTDEMVTEYIEHRGRRGDAESKVEGEPW